MSVLKKVKKKKKTKFTSYIKNYLKELSLNIKKIYFIFIEIKLIKKV